MALTFTTADRVGSIGGYIGGIASILGSGILGGTNTDNYVNKETFDVQLQLIESQKNNAILSADLASEKKMVEVFNAANDKINTVRDELRTEIRSVENKVDSNAAAQAVINSEYGSQLTLNNSQIAQLYSLTQLKIPNTSVCPGWGNVTITPSGGTTNT